MDFIEDKYIPVFKLNEEINNFINKELNGILQKLDYIKKQINDIKLIKDGFELDKSKANEIKLNIQLLSKSEEKLISVIFKSFDENINYSVICKKTDTFEKIESLFYDKYPQYKNLNYNFLSNGKKIERNKNLDENKIKNSDIIIFENK